MTCKKLSVPLLALSALSLFIVGCGSGTPSTVPVSGTLVFEDGKAVAGASLRFVNALGGRESSGYTGKDGSFTLSTFSQDDGAIPGDYTVVVTKIAAPDTGGLDTKNMKPEDMMKMGEKLKMGGGAKKVEDPVPAIYGDAKTSPLKHKVDSGSKGITLKLKRN